MYCNSIQNEYNESTLYLQQGLYVLSIGWIFWIIINAYCRTFIGKITFILYTILGLPIVMLFLAKIGKLRVVVIGVEVKRFFLLYVLFPRFFKFWFMLSSTIHNGWQQLFTNILTRTWVFVLWWLTWIWNSPQKTTCDM